MREKVSGLSVAPPPPTFFRSSSGGAGHRSLHLGFRGSENRYAIQASGGEVSISFLMGSQKGAHVDPEFKEDVNKKGTICLHAFSDLSHVPPTTFVYLLKECYIYGTHKATQKFRLLQQQVLLALHNKPQPGPATFIIQCLNVVPLLGPPYSEGFSHLLTSSFRRLHILGKVSDFSEAKSLAARLFLDVLSCVVRHEERILVKLVQIFDIEFKDVREAIDHSNSNINSDNLTKEYLGNHIYSFIESQSYATAVALMERFSIFEHEQSALTFLDKMIQDREFTSAEKWATIMGKSMISLLIQRYLNMDMFKKAYELIKKNNLEEEFPDVYHLYKQSLLKKLAEKGCWDVAEVRAKKDKELLVYLVYLALEAGYPEKVDELCDRYSLSGFIGEREIKASETQYLHLDEIVLEEVQWIDEIDGLLSATKHIEECKVIGVDCEWKPNYEKGSKPNKVSIMQIASDTKVFIFDLMKLHIDEPGALDNCFKRILHSPSILKIGYNLQCDLQQLSLSYRDLECFHYCEMLLDMEKVFKNPRGGLSGLTQKILGVGLNKTRRNSNWEQRPLSQNQIEYAALDAAVLLRIFSHVHGRPDCTGSTKEEKSRLEWKSHIVFRRGNPKVRWTSS